MSWQKRNWNGQRLHSEDFSRELEWIFDEFKQGTMSLNELEERCDEIITELANWVDELEESVDQHEEKIGELEEKIEELECED